MDDRAESGVLASVLMVGGVVVAAIALYALFWWSEPPEPPPAVGVLAAPSSSSQTRALTIASLATPLQWGDVAAILDGEPLAYDPALVAARSYCVAPAEAACWVSDDEERPMEPTQQLRVHDVDIAGKTLTLVHTEQNQILLSIRLG